jgi:polyisoprenoid-binding protein YceI
MPCKICIASLIVATPLALLAAGSPSAPQGTPAAATTPATTNSRTWKVDDVHSMAMFRVQHMGAGMFWGRFDDVSGIVTTTGSGPDAIAFDITIDPASISSGNDKLNAHLKSPDFFSVKEFPSMTFKSTSAKRGADGMWDVTGDLTMHGVTKSITAKVEMTGMAKGRGGEAAGFEATFVVDRSQFGMNYGVEKGAIGKDVRVIVGLEVGAESK